MSGIDYYPNGNTVMTEESQRGRQFLAEVVADYWEPSTEPVEALGVQYEPIIYFCAADGTIVDRLDAVWDRGELTERIDLLLAG